MPAGFSYVISKLHPDKPFRCEGPFLARERPCRPEGPRGWRGYFQDPGLLPLAVKVRDEEGSRIGSVIMVLISLLLVFVGIRVFRNGFPRNRPAPKPEN